VGYEVQASPQLTALPSIQRWQTQANKLVRLKLFTSDVGRALIESLNRAVGSAVFGHDETVASGEASEETRRRAEERRANRFNEMVFASVPSGVLSSLKHSFKLMDSNKDNALKCVAETLTREWSGWHRKHGFAEPRRAC
jgi:hypothetical protein